MMNLLQGNRKKHVSNLYLIVTLLLLVISSACSKEEREVEPSERVNIEAYIEEMEYSKANNTIDVELPTNLPKDTVVDIIANLGEDPYSDPYVGGSYRVAVDSEQRIKTSIDNPLDRDIMNGDYYVVMRIDSEENLDFLHNDEMGGYFAEISEHYKNFQNIEIEELDFPDYTFKYRVPGTVTITDAHSNSEAEAIEVEESLSQDFSAYNRKYYEAYKNQLDLIGSNFELIYDGYSTPNLIDDLIRWTKEFNELLDVYAQKAKPQNDVDQGLYVNTIQMINEQREANDYIITGLKNNDDESLMIAGEYLKTTSGLFLDGNSLIE